jgi:maltooligosyltrehalose trehalohydrolase
MPFGTRISPEGGVGFRLWAPAAGNVELCLETANGRTQVLPMTAGAEGWHFLAVPGARIGDLYRYRISPSLLVPDPVSRFQPGDLHGPSEIIDPESFVWTDTAWQGRPWAEAVIYELNVGAFSAAGDYRGVLEKLDYLADLGITALELMPLAEFPGRRDWGYDGALLFAPSHCYGRPEELKHLVREAHRRGLMVILDLVINHFGPEGNYLHAYARQEFFAAKHQTPWGAAINFSGAGSRTVRDFFVHNVLYWLEEYHLDGLRFDAVHAIFDDSRPDILEEIASAVQQGPGRRRLIHLILEDDRNRAHYLERNGAGQPRFFTAQWNDDIHHAAHVLLTGEREGYYGDYCEEPIKHLGRCLTEGFAYQGESSRYRNGAARGEASGHLPPTAFVAFLQNHDQIGNRALGERLIHLCAERDLLVVVALLLLAPSPPLIFMGEEFGAETPFYFFCDFGPELATRVTAGRREEFAGFSRFRAKAVRDLIPDPNLEETFLASKLDWGLAEDPGKGEYRDHYREILALRQGQIIPRLPGIKGGRAGYRILAPRALQAWWELGDGSHLKVLLNLAGHRVSCGATVAGRALYRFPRGGEKDWAAATIPARSIGWYLLEPEASHD